MNCVLCNSWLCIYSSQVSFLLLLGITGQQPLLFWSKYGRSPQTSKSSSKGLEKDGCKSSGENGLAIVQIRSKLES